MNKSISTINELLVETFNDILTIEQNAINSGDFKDISVTEVHTIDAIGMYEPRTMTEVAKELDITVGTLTIAINNLVKKEYVERKKSEEDRRLVMIQLTKKGKLVYRIHEKFHSDMVKATIEGLTKEEEETLVKSLENLNRFFREKYNLKNGKKRE